MFTVNTKNCSPAFMNAYNYIRVKGAISTIVETYVDGDIPAAYKAYDVKKYYLAAEIYVSCTAGLTNSKSKLILYRGNADASTWAINMYPVWNTTAAALNYMHNDILMKDVAFMYLEVSLYDKFRFNGYIINLV